VLAPFSHYMYISREAGPKRSIGHAHLCICLSLVAFPHYCTDPDVTWGNGTGVPSSCALLGGCAIGAWVSLLWQHSAEREMSASVVLALCLVYLFCLPLFATALTAVLSAQIIGSKEARKAPLHGSATP